MKLQKIIIGVGIALLVFIPIWLFLIVPELENIPEDYSFRADILGTEKDSYELGGEFEPEFIYNGVRKDKVIRVEGNILVIEGIFDAEALDGTDLFTSKEEYVVDRVTRQNVKGYENKDRDGYFIFPPKTIKRSYDLWFPMYNDKVTLDFQREDIVEGLGTYYFKGQEKKVDDTNGYAFLDLIPEQYFGYTDSVIEMWVEPISGKPVKYKDDGISYYADKITGENVHIFTDWSNIWSDDTITNQVRLAQNEKQRIILIERIVPILLALIGIALILASFIGRKFIGEGETGKAKILKK